VKIEMRFRNSTFVISPFDRMQD